MTKEKVLKDFNLTEDSYQRMCSIIDWPKRYEQFRKAAYIRRVVYKAKLVNEEPEAYLIYIKAKKILITN